MSFFGLDQIVAFMSANAYLAIFLLMFGESTILPIPSEVVLPFAGFLVWSGAINPFLGFADGVGASLFGNLVGFLVGYVFGVDVVYRYGRRFGFSMKSYRDGEKWVKKYGYLFAFISKLLPVVRSFSSVVCGALKMEVKRFTAWTFAGIAIWSAVLMYLGYYVAGNWQEIVTLLTNVGLYLSIAVVVGLVFLLRNWLYGIFVMVYRRVRS